MGVSPEFWAGRRVLITGHTGFKGAWLALWLGRLGASLTGYALAPPTRPNLFEAAEVSAIMRSLHGDVRDAERLAGVFGEATPEIVFHLAAQSLVRASYDDPVGTFSTNVMGTVQVLQACRAARSVRAAVVVTSDKCYEEHATRQPYRESDPLGGHDPYSASKACAEIATGAFRCSYFATAGTGVAVASARAGNVIGGGDWAADRLLTDLVGAFSAGRQPQLRNPGATRPWQHVLDPLAGYLMLAERLYAEGERFAGAWNFGPALDSSADVRSVADRVARLWGTGAAWTLDSRPQPREAAALALDARKAREHLGWSPRLDLDATLAWTVSWYKDWQRGAPARQLAESQIGRFMEGRQ